MKATTIGTACFLSFSAALRYYKAQGFGRGDVEKKVRDSEIHIGKPTVKDDEKLLVDSDGRYLLQSERS